MIVQSAKLVKCQGLLVIINFGLLFSIFTRNYRVFTYEKIGFKFCIVYFEQASTLTNIYKRP